MAIVTGRRTPAWLLGLSLLAASASVLGCAADGSLIPILATPTAQRESRVDEQRAYELGHRYGRLDDQAEKRADYRRYEDAYAWETESAFATGYRDGYSGRASRYRPDPRGWTDGGRDDDDDRRYGDDRYADDRDVASAVPNWLVGDYRGWDELYGSDVALRVHPNASVTLVTGGRARQGVYRGGQVHLRNGVYAISRVRDGIRFTQQGDARNSVYLRRSD